MSIRRSLYDYDCALDSFHRKDRDKRAPMCRDGNRCKNGMCPFLHLPKQLVKRGAPSLIQPPPPTLPAPPPGIPGMLQKHPCWKGNPPPSGRAMDSHRLPDGGGPDLCRVGSAAGRLLATASSGTRRVARQRAPNGACSTPRADGARRARRRRIGNRLLAPRLPMGLFCSSAGGLVRCGGSGLAMMSRMSVRASRVLASRFNRTR